MTTLITIFIRLFGIAMLAVVFSCGGGGGSSSSPSNGSLALAINGLPAGVAAAVTVTGPNSFSQSVSASQTLSNLAPGTYTIAALNAGSGTLVFAPQPPSQTAAVSAGATSNVMVNYSGLRLRLQEVVPSGLASPLFLTAPAGDARLFIVERAGTIRIFQSGVLLATPFLDISARVSMGGEGGLLSMAFDPNYATNGFFYVYFIAFTPGDAGGEIAIERFQVSSNANVANTSPLRIITIRHPTNTNHYGGQVAFGPDGFLYLAPGDGGGGGDQPGNAQNLNTLLGKLLRLDVSTAQLAQPYAIPTSNPFVSQGVKCGSGQIGRCAEIWANGLRNPFRYAFDFTANQLYIGDVGQSAREEVDVAAVGSAGLNYGWNITEGSLCFNPPSGCNMTGLTPPVLDYVNPTDGCSVIGGFVYRGTAIPELQGRYFYSDFCRGWLRSFLFSGGAAVERIDWGITSMGNIFSFGEDGQKELYMLNSSKVFKIVRQ